jgi:hypothetical protein
MMRTDIPRDGIYVFYERGETVTFDTRTCDRIVRIGTHAVRVTARGASSQRLFGRLGAHFSGNKNASSFRKDVGAALLQREDRNHPLLTVWCSRQRSAESSRFERIVSKEMRERFTFVYFRVDAMQDRQMLERGLIALLAQHPLGHPSSTWLGHFATSHRIRERGLWNKEHVEAEPLSAEELDLLNKIVTSRAHAVG